MHVLITGGSGFLGSALANHFSDAGHRVSAILRSSSKVSHLRALRECVDLIRMENVRDLFAIFSQLRPTAVVHTACSYGREGEWDFEVAETNICFGLGVIQASIESGAEHFVNAGTALPREMNAYALSKRQFAEWGTQYGERRLIRFTDVIMQQLYGPHDDRSKFTTHVIQACGRNVPYLELTPGKQERDFLYIKDAVSAFACILNCRGDNEWIRTIELGSGTASSIESYVRLVHRLTSSRTKLEFGALPYRRGEPMRSKADTKALRLMGWTPAYSLERGVEETILEEFGK